MRILFVPWCHTLYKNNFLGESYTQGSLLADYAQGGTQDIRIRGGQSKKFSGNPKISLQLQCNPKISAHFTYINLYMNIKYPQAMQIEVRIASIEHRNINITMFGIKKYHQHSFSFLWTQKYHFWQHSDPKISTYLPVCACAECPPWGIMAIFLCSI